MQVIIQLATFDVYSRSQKYKRECHFVPAWTYESAIFSNEWTVRIKALIGKTTVTVEKKELHSE